MKWVTREKVKVDRVACPWLIKRFIDKEAEFIFIPAETDPSTIDYGTPYDMQGVELGHHGEECSFDAFVKKYNLYDDSAIVEMQKVIRGADTGKFEISPLSAGLEAFAEGFRLSCKDDHEVLEKEFPMYDAMYAYFKNKVSR
jgi:hypothetical protein